MMTTRDIDEHTALTHTALTIVNMSLSSTVTEIFSVEYWGDFEVWVRGCSRSLKIVAIDKS